MTVAPLGIVLVSLLSFSATAPTDNECSQLNRPLKAEQLDQDGIESLWMVLNRTADSQTLLMDQANGVAAQQQPIPMKEQCLRVTMNVSLVSGKDLEFHIPNAASYHRFLHTCSDCLLMHTYNNENNFQMFYLFGRNTTMTDSDLKTFRKQAECLQFPLPSKFQYDTSKELCPE